MTSPDASGSVSSSAEDVKYLDESSGYVALSDPRRREVIRLLDEADESMSLMDLAREIVRREGEESQPVDEAELKQVLISLYHIHVPKLADAGFVRYNRDEQRVTLSAGAPLDFLETFDA